MKTSIMNIRNYKVIRNSNFELLRIFSMLMILFYHCFHQLRFTVEDDPVINYFYYVLHNGVPLFLLISGYFSIKTNWIKIFSFYLYCVIWGILPYCIAVVCNGEPFVLDTLLKQFLPFSHPNVWYPKFYFWLLLLAPLLINPALNNITIRNHAFIIIVLYICIVYFGCIWHDSSIAGGKSIIYFLYIYILGGLLRRIFDKEYDEKDKLLKSIDLVLSKTKVLGSVLLFYLIASAIGIFFLRPSYSNILGSLIGAYHGPILPITSILIFTLFRKINIRSFSINYIASSVFAVYLFHENLFSDFLFRNRVTDMYQTYSTPFFILYTVLLIIVIFIVAVVLDNIIRKPISAFITYTITNCINRLK